MFEGKRHMEKPLGRCQERRSVEQFLDETVGPGAADRQVAPVAVRVAVVQFARVVRRAAPHVGIEEGAGIGVGRARSSATEAPMRGGRSGPHAPR